MISRTYLTRGGNLELLQGVVPEASTHLEEEGYAIVRGAFSIDDVAALTGELQGLFDRFEPDVRLPGATAEDYADFRYEALNRCAAAQSAVAHRAILNVIEPLLGEDCHVVSNTAWRNQPQREKAPFDVGNPWHVDAGPHVPRPADVPWDERIPYPVFMIGCHILLQDCGLESGPTGFIPRSHTSGQLPPGPDGSGMISYKGRGPAVPLGQAGDVVFFVSDVWHRRMPTGPGDEGRFFLQVQYGRRRMTYTSPDRGAGGTAGQGRLRRPLPRSVRGCSGRWNPRMNRAAKPFVVPAPCRRCDALHGAPASRRPSDVD